MSGWGWRVGMRRVGVGVSYIPLGLTWQVPRFQLHKLKQNATRAQLAVPYDCAAHTATAPCDLIGALLWKFYTAPDVKGW